MYRLDVRHADVAVISDELIKMVAWTDLDTVNNTVIDEAEQSVDFGKLQTLSLSFRHIFKMENLEALRHLVKLQLDNNVLQEIDNIGHLVHLEWLDLSFNNISTIKGLETLVKLTDLSLYNNCIVKLENLDMLKELQVLSIGNNLLQYTEELLHLKGLEKLRVLNLRGNPVCMDPEYRPFLLAHLEKLKYLDYTLVDDSETIQAREQYQDELEAFKEDCAIAEAALAREAEQRKYLCMLKDANAIILETLIEDMFKDDMAISRIEALPGLRNLIDEYTEKAKTAAEEAKLVVLEKHAYLTKEVDKFEATYEKLQADAQATSIRAIDLHRQRAKKILKQVVATQLSKAGGSSDKLHNELMNVELGVVETAHELIAAMKGSIDLISSEARDFIINHFRTIENLENVFFENVCQLVVTLLERMASDDEKDDDYFTDDCRAILNDREALDKAINASHDIHIGKLRAQKDAMRDQSLVKVAEIVKNIEGQERSRNRARIAEVLYLKEKHLTDINHVREEIKRVG